MSSFIDFVRDQYKTLPIVPTSQDCAGKTYIVTGANTGLGFECAKHLVGLSAKRVILGVRSLSRGDTAKAKIEAETGREGVAEVWHLDLNSHESVKEFGEKVQGLDRVDAIIENASVALVKWTIAEGLETTLTVNVVSTMLLAILVLPKLQESAKRFGISPHLVVVGSGVAFQAKGVLEKIHGDIFEGLGRETMDKR
jgi:NAD(P)-dependent dehydrogenase (short-subunit alcohol dehydrogenase family)